MQFLDTIFYFVLTLGVLVFVHEFGHFLAAKLCHMRVDRFSIGFPPRAFGKKIGDTDYCVSWIPIGGYVKIAGMIDESFDTEFLEKPPEPWEFRSKPIWQRMVVIAAGVTMNILLAIAIFWGINYVQGRTVRETTDVGFVSDGSVAQKAGLAAGDRILRISGKAVSSWDEVLNNLYVESISNDVTISLERKGRDTTITLLHADIAEQAQKPLGILPAHTEIVVNTVESGMPADKMGLKPLDVLLSLNGTPIGYDQRVTDIVHANAGKPLEVGWKRGDKLMRGTATPTSAGLIGISFSAQYTGPVSRVQYTLFGALPVGLKEIASISGLFVQQIWQIVTGKMALSQGVGGPIKIAQMATQTAELGVVTYLGFMALLSISLAILNILPFPALDGGHLAFLLYEGLFRREIPVKIKMGLQKAGFVLLIAFMAFVVYNDLVHF